MEVRVYAENPQNDFLPDIGRLQTYRRPHGPGVRVDDGFEEGMDVPIYYDPMISKLITYGRDRDQAIRRMIRAIDDYEITGLSTTLSFCKMVMEHEAFVSGEFDTHFVQSYFKPEELDAPLDDRAEIAAQFTAKTYNQSQNTHVGTTQNEGVAAASLWKERRRS
jgi:acetyl/propionyl-CoA carboxylase alpha subunit